MQLAFGLLLLLFAFLLIKVAKPNAEGISPPAMENWSVATAATLIFTIFSGLGMMLVVFWFVGLSTSSG